jgi:hypothetical protein
MELIMASTTETSTLEGGDVAQDTALAEETLAATAPPRDEPASSRVPAAAAEPAPEPAETAPQEPRPDHGVPIRQPRSRTRMSNARSRP